MKPARLGHSYGGGGEPQASAGQQPTTLRRTPMETYIAPPHAPRSPTTRPTPKDSEAQNPHGLITEEKPLRGNADTPA